MKNYLLYLLLVVSSFVFAQNFHDTQGKLEIASSGQATYSLPIAMPASINNVGPVINLNYSSGQQSGIAGQGWSINNISTISRMSTRMDIDGYRDGVDFDDNDKLALDGQRLLLKSGTYWADGSVYETEVQSNSKIELKVTGTTTYFIVTNPDGSRLWYGDFDGNNFVEGSDATAYYITRFEDTNGNFITYTYGRPLNKGFCIQRIQFSANKFTNTTPLNKIVFTYKTASRTERGYTKGIKIERGEILDKIEVFTNNTLFRKYQLTHSSDSFGYQRVTQLQEFNSNLEPANPVNFEYKTTPDDVTEILTPQEFITPEIPRLNGDFDGDGRLDFVLGSKIYTNLYKELGTSYSMSNISNWGSQFTATTLNNGKLNQKQSIVNTTGTTNSLSFQIYNLDANGLTASYTKNINIENFGYCYNNCIIGNNCTQTDDNGVVTIVPCYDTTSGCTNAGTRYTKESNEYIEGDFNGDGISEVLILGYSEYKTYGPNRSIAPTDGDGGKEGNSTMTVPVDSTCFWTYSKSPNFSSAHLVDLNPNSPTTINTSGYYRLNSTEAISIGKRFAMDFNGDGKSDILAISPNGNYNVVSFKQLTQAPWIELEIIGQGVIDKYNTTKQMLFGDYNGDGRPDIMLPDSDGGQNHTLWHIYYNNPNPAGGNYFVKESHNIVEYWPDSKDTFSTGEQFSFYYAIDVNKDGKSDMVRIWLNRFQPNSFTDPKDFDTQWIVSAYINNLGKNGSFNHYYSSGDHSNYNPVVAYPIVSKVNHGNLNTEIIMVRYQDNFPRTTTYINFNKNSTDDNLLTKVTQSNGAIVDQIQYEPMISYQYTSTYNSNESLNYPLVEINKLPNSWIVSKLTNTSLGITKFQDFAYEGFSVNMYGLGSLGFIKSARCSWYTTTTSNKKIWSVSVNNPLLRGANISTYSYQILPPNNFSFTSIGYINKTDNVFSETTDPVSKRYTILLTKQTAIDYLNNIAKETLYESYSPNYNLPTRVTNNNYQAIPLSLQGTSTIITDYDTAVTGLGSDYYIGRPKQVTTTTTAYGDTKKSIDKYFYTGGNLTRTEKNANDDRVSIVENYDYFSNGLLKTKTISAIGTDRGNAVSPRTISYTYDTTNRFVKTTTDAEGMVTTNNSYDPIYGQITSTTNPLGLVTTSTFDTWGKPTKVTDFLGKSINYSYAKVGDLYVTTQTGDDGSASVSESDVLGKVIRKGTKDFAGNWIYVKSEYDALGKKLRDSQPYAGSSSPTQWTSYEYDNYLRPIKTTEYTGKIVTTAYNETTVTVNDEVMTKSKTTNANGHLVSATDTPGGTITFKYDAMGNLLESDYNGVKITTTYDNWGRKVTMTDPSAGVGNDPGLFTYRYNAYGELLRETTPKGSTNLILNAVGKIVSKSVNGLSEAERTDIRTTYTYDGTTKLLTRIDATSPYDGDSSYTYGFDPVTKQINQTVETLPYATFTKKITFDNFGRVDNETTIGTAHGKTSSKTIKHTYKNGMPWQLVDGATVVYQANTFNEKGQLTSASLGNGISIANSYDNYGYATEAKHSSNNGLNTIMTLQTSFEAKRGNLIQRTNSLFSTKDYFNYDSLDRLSMRSEEEPVLFTNTFTNSTDGYFYNGTPGTSLFNPNRVTCIGNTLNVNTKEIGKGAEKQILTNVFGGKRIRIKGIFTKGGGGDVHLKIVENGSGITTPKETVVAVLSASQNILTDYVVTQNCNISIKFVSADSVIDPFRSTTTTAIITGAANFTLDNISAQYVNYETQQYDDRGRITQNNVGKYNYNFTAKPYQNSSVESLSASAQNYFGLNSGLNITYNAYKAPVQIENANIDILNFAYNAMLQRSAMYYGSTSSDILARPYRKYYSADGSMEVKYTLATGAVEFITYIGGSAYNAPAVVKSDGTTQNYFYLHRDYQGSILAITNAAAQIVEKRLFDVWGTIIKVQDGAGNNLAGLTFFDRGYTGHEHLQSVGLINMNARLYDPVLHRFLSPDNYIQDPYNTQNYNRYGYCVNNPTKYTDITGNVFGLDDALIVGAVVGVASYFLTTYLSGQPITLEGAVKSAFIGAISGMVTFGIGEGAQAVGNFYLRASLQALAHGSFQGTLAGIQGGNFWQGFASGSLSSIVSSAWQGGSSFVTSGNVTEEFVHKGISGGLGLKNGIGTILFGTVSGGVGARLTGGNFWQGAVTGGIVSGLNHSVAHGGKTGKKSYTHRSYEKDDNGKVTSEKLIYFKKNHKEMLMYNQALSESLVDNTLTVYGHGNTHYFNGVHDTQGVDSMLYNDSVMYRNSILTNSSLTMYLKSCNTGNYSEGGYRTISEDLTEMRSRLTIHAPAAFWLKDGSIQNDAGYNMFMNGAKVGWDRKL